MTVLLLLAACDGRHGTQPTLPEPTSPETGTSTPTPTALTGDAAALQAELEAAGFVVGVGEAAELDTADCCAWDSCFLFNPDNDYIGWFAPRAPDQLAPNPAERADGRSAIWRLRPDEAIVAIGRTPPPTAYFSFRSYLHDRWTTGGARETLMFNLGDSLNHLMMTDGGGPFDTDFVLVSTADAATEAAVRAAIASAGLDVPIVGTDVISGDDLRMGLQPEADTFRMQFRLALFDDPDAGAAYLASPPITVLRVTPAVEGAHVPLDPPPLRPRGTGTDESAWAGALDALGEAIVAAYPDYVATPLVTFVSPTGETDCPPGCNRDTYFAVTQHYRLPVQADAFVVTYGVNHERTGKSVYSNFSVVDVEHLASPAAVHSRAMQGSARAYLDGPQVDDLYAWTIARSCAGAPYCIEVPTSCPGFPSENEGSVAFRAYPEATTATGPRTEELLVDQAILFTRPASP